MLPRAGKRSPGRLVPVAMLILFAQFWELYVMVGPAVGHGGAAAHAHPPLVEFAGTLDSSAFTRSSVGRCAPRRGAAQGSVARRVPGVSPLDADGPPRGMLHGAGAQADLLAFLVLGLVGGVAHCVGMCSPFVMIVARRFGVPEGWHWPPAPSSGIRLAAS